MRRSSAVSLDSSTLVTPQDCHGPSATWVATVGSKLKLQGDLGDAAWLRLQDLAEGGAVAVAVDRVRAVKLRVVEGVEGLEAEFQGGGFREPGEFAGGHIVIVDAGAVEEAARRVAKGAPGVGAKELTVEGQGIAARVMVDVQRAQTGIVVREIDADAVDAIVLDLHEGIVSEALKGHGQTGGVAGHAGNRPALGETIGKMEEFFDGQLIVVAEDEVVLQIEGRDGVFLAEIERIDLLLNAGSPVHRFAVGVAWPRR